MSNRPLGRKARKIVDAVWTNYENKRYVPMAYASFGMGAGTGWGIYDKIDKRFIEGKEIVKIDPHTPLMLS